MTDIAETQCAEPMPFDAEELSRCFISLIAAAEMLPDDDSLKTEDLILWLKKRSRENLRLRIKREIDLAKEAGENWLVDELSILLIATKRKIQNG